MKNNNRNSRDDKSKPGSRSTTGRGRSATDSSYKGKSSFGDKEGKDAKFGGEKSYRPRTEKEGERGERRERPTDRGERGERGEHKPYASRPGKEGGSRDSAEGQSRSYVKKDHFGPKGDKPFRKFDDKKGGAARSTDSRPFRKFDDKKSGDSARSTEGRPFRKFDDKPGDSGRSTEGKTFRKFDDKKSDGPRSSDSRPYRKRETEGGARPTFSKDRDKSPVLRGRKPQEKVDDGMIRLNRYIANSGICSRRKADELIAAGVVSVNGVPVSELGHKVDPSKDEVRYNGELLKREKKTYVLLNKPKDYITTTDDPQERRTVMQLVEKASRERIYPVGRLDRNTTGLLLMTNDGDLADKLSHPKNGITKIYHVELSKSLSQGDMNKIQFGLELEDGLIKPDSVSYVSGASKKEVGIQIHSGKNRIVRRIFEHLGYEVVKLDRVVYGNLTKKDLPRGRWRYLEEHELIQIKHLIK
ncbi:23S rRNA pseudouridine2605 synthase [Pedobacter duraquae]|uniref:Pseudouridine synthase n=2 Tax=Pedobacter duraquae TaxID=425511 RepID=A0A4R6IIF6_9SPHI|nr:23S rRNA pseudouridine2605 synthase [Pedobacter duraquae]